jgi:diguanylate cyclase (GGDEF)-like protein
MLTGLGMETMGEATGSQNKTLPDRIQAHDRAGGAALARLLALVIFAFALAPSASASAGLSPQDKETLALENRVADDPHAALKEAAQWFGTATKAADQAGQLRAMRLKVMALSQLEDSTRLIAEADAGLGLARALKDAQAECEFLTAKGVKLSLEGKFLDAQKLYDQAIQVAEKAGLARAATGVQVAKAFDLSLLGRDADALGLLSKAHQKFIDMGDASNARMVLASIGNAYINERSSPEDLKQAASFLERAIPPDAERTRRHELATIYANLGAVHHRQKAYGKARDTLAKSIALYRALGDANGEAFALYRGALILADEKSWREALGFLDRAAPAFVLSQESTMQFNIARARAKSLAELDLKRESLEALGAAQAIASRSDSAWIKANFLDSAVEVYARLGDFEKAYKTQRELREADRVLARAGQESEEKELKTQFESKQKEAENELLRARERESEARRLALGLTVALLCLTLGGLVWYLVRQNQQNRRFANLAMRDDLTGIANRRSIIEFARSQHRLAVTQQQKLAIALLDIDRFKAINDEFGHAVGDQVLVAFATICQHQLRSIDRIGRYGGEEFMLVMPGSELSQIPQVFTRLRLAVRQLSVEGYAEIGQITFSMGAAEIIGASDDLDGAIKRADDALYRAKQGGRDRHESG